MSQPEVTSEKAAATQRLFDALVLLGRSLKARGSDWGHVDPELSRADIVTLGVLATRGTCRPGQVAEVLCVDRSVISRQLAALDHLGLIERAADPEDGRAELVSLSGAGQQRLVAARDAMCAALAERLDPWDVAEIDQVIDTLSDLTQRLQNPLATAQKLDHHV
jgi:DNA-binding MarR family transcriptional regulator